MTKSFDHESVITSLTPMTYVDAVALSSLNDRCFRLQMGMISSSRENTGVKLPPISTGHHAKPSRYSFDRFGHALSSLYSLSRSLPAKSDPHTSRQTLPFVPSEHLIKLPSDIYASPKAGTDDRAELD